MRHFSWNRVGQCHADHLDGELELVVHLRHQKIMAQNLPHLHHPHNGSINLVLTILKDPFCGAGLLFHLGEKARVSLKSPGPWKWRHFYKAITVPFLSSGSGLFWSWKACVWNRRCKRTCPRPPHLCFLGFWWVRALFRRQVTAESGAVHCPL